jgi:hypothetical protein
VRKELQKIKVVLLLLLWLQMLVPAALLHSFCEHHDTEHPHFSFGLTISEQHHHCLVLELSLPSVTHSTEDLKLRPVEDTAPVYFSFNVFTCMADKVIVGNRGPPTLLSAV